jgi:hypothetical protein
MATPCPACRSDMLALPPPQLASASAPASATAPIRYLVSDMEILLRYGARGATVTAK